MEIGVIGLGTMGANLARNAARNGAQVVVFNRTQDVTEKFVKEFQEEAHFEASKSYKEFVQILQPPRAILLMVQAGEAVDAVLEDLMPFLEKGDTVIDAGNSHYRDTERRIQTCAEKGIRFLGMGVSGGEEGALHGPSMMPGGDRDAYNALKELFSKMAAEDGEGGKCVSYIGPGGSGHFVKMVHNGIEYGIMQLIAESYALLKGVGGFTNAQLAETYAAWSADEHLQSFLMEITAQIFIKKDDLGEGDMIDAIRDAAGQKGTGKWTTQAALEYGVAIPTINAAVDARILSGSASERASGKHFPAELDEQDPVPPPLKLMSIVRNAYELSLILTYIQGFRLLQKAQEEEGWNMDLAEVARMWRGGCIIRSAILPRFQHALGEDPVVAKAAKEALLERFRADRQRDWRRTVQFAQSRGIAVPAFGASLHYYDALRAERLPQNLIQAQRDYFGAHTFARNDREGTFHLEWQL